MSYTISSFKDLVKAELDLNQAPEFYRLPNKDGYILYLKRPIPDPEQAVDDAWEKNR